MKILAVDDDPMALLVLKSALQKRGYEVETTSCATEALQILHQGECRMVISDWEMPAMSGLELCRTIRQQGFAEYLYIILLTSKSGRGVTVEGLRAGADDFMAKPFDPEELDARIQVGVRALSLEMLDLTVFAMAKLAESRDSDTGAHLERVRNYARAIAQQLAGNKKYDDEIDGNFIRLIYQTSPLHDIGKVAIPDAVLLKPGRLTPAEYEIMKTHATLGANTLEAAIRQHPTARFLRVARDIAAGHHEHFDGQGYPNGLVGTAIPLAARIVAVADVYDALTSRRVYKPALSHQHAMQSIMQGAGSHFDPDVVAAFLACESRITEIRNRFTDEAVPTQAEDAMISQW